MSRASELNPIKPKVYKPSCKCYERHGAVAMNPFHKCDCARISSDKGLICPISK